MKAGRNGRWNGKALWLVTALAASFLAMPPGDRAGAAENPICRQLEAQLASIPTGGSSNTGKYDTAIARQGEQLDKTRARSRAAGCGSAVYGRNVASCGALNATIARMERNLLKLQGQRARLGSDNQGNAARQRAHILASLEINGCRGSTPRAASIDAPEGQSLYRRIQEMESENRVRVDDLRQLGRQDLASSGSLIAAPEPQRNLRTLCVRTCDGYFFPVSDRATRFDFARDQQSCEQMCPGAQVELYYHSFPDEESAQMVSAANDTPYTELPTAFLYKQANVSRPPQCGCSAPARNFRIVAGETKQEAASDDVTPASDTQQVASSAAGGGDNLDLGELRSTHAPAPADGSRNVRVVGPAFLPDPEAAIDLRAPGRKDDQ